MGTALVNCTAGALAAGGRNARLQLSLGDEVGRIFFFFFDEAVFDEATSEWVSDGCCVSSSRTLGAGRHLGLGRPVEHT